MNDYAVTLPEAGEASYLVQPHIVRPSSLLSSFSHSHILSSDI